MAELATINKPEGAFNVATLRGRLEKSEVFNGQRYSTIMTPAPDQYSHPQRLRVRSNKELGIVGQDVTVGVTIGGFRRTWAQRIDPSTGEVKPGGEAIDISLTAIES